MGTASVVSARADVIDSARSTMGEPQPTVRKRGCRGPDVRDWPAPSSRSVHQIF